MSLRTMKIIILILLKILIIDYVSQVFQTESSCQNSPVMARVNTVDSRVTPWVPSPPCYNGGGFSRLVRPPGCWLQSYPTLCNSMNSSPVGSSVHGDSPGMNTGVGCHFLLKGIFPTQGLNPCLLCALHGRQDFYH